MKKTYSKPSICMEQIALAQQIACCGAGSRGTKNEFGQATSGDPASCGFRLNGTHDVIFTSAVAACEIKIKSGASFNGVCYNTVQPGYTIFAS